MQLFRHCHVMFSLLWAAAVGAPALRAADYLVYFGTYTRGESKGIYVAHFDGASGRLGAVELAAETPSPSFLAIHPNQRFLYAVSELYQTGGPKGGAVSAFAIDRASGKLTFLNKVSSRGGGPCHLAIDKTGKFIAVANYGTGSAAVMPIQEDGRLGEASGFQQHSGSSVDPKRQQGPHAHSVNFSPDNRFLFVADLGLDKVLVYRFDASQGAIEPNDPPSAAVKPGSGPRHFTFHPNGRFAYVINEMASTVTAFAYDARRGALREIQTISTLPKDFTGTNHTAEVLAHPSGKFLYGSNRGHDSIAAFSISAKGTLTALGQTSTQGKVPRNFNLDPTGAWLLAANQDSDNVVVFRIDAKTGRLEPNGQSVRVVAPVCIKFLALD
jgi:6-phosphogluconolactonase